MKCKFAFWVGVGVGAGYLAVRWAFPYIVAKAEAVGLDDAWDVFNEEVE